MNTFERLKLVPSKFAPNATAFLKVVVLALADALDDGAPVAPVKLVPERLAPVKFDPVTLASLKSAPLRLLFLNDAFDTSSPENLPLP